MNTNLSTQEIYTLLTGRLSMTLNRTLLQHFKANNIPLTREQWSILAVLWKEDGCSQQALAIKWKKNSLSFVKHMTTIED